MFQLCFAYVERYLCFACLCVYEKTICSLEEWYSKNKPYKNYLLLVSKGDHKMLRLSVLLVVLM